MREFDFTGKDPLMDKMIMHLNVLGPSVKYEVFCKVDIVEVVARSNSRPSICGLRAEQRYCWLLLIAPRDRCTS